MEVQLTNLNKAVLNYYSSSPCIQPKNIFAPYVDT